MKKKFLKVVGILVGLCLICILFFIGILGYTIFSDERTEITTEPVTDVSIFKINNVETLREITGLNELPEFVFKEVWYDDNDSLRQNPHLECVFKQKMTDEEYMSLTEKCDTVYWKYDKDNTMYFEKECVCDGENLFVFIDKLSRSGFYLDYRLLKSR